MEEVRDDATALSMSVLAAVPLEAYSKKTLVLLELWDNSLERIVWEVRVHDSTEPEPSKRFGEEFVWKYEHLNNALTTFIVQANLKVKFGPRIEEKFNI